MTAFRPQATVRARRSRCAAIPDEDWLGLFQLNVMSGVRAARHYLPRMVARGCDPLTLTSTVRLRRRPQSKE